MEMPKRRDLYVKVDSMLHSTFLSACVSCSGCSCSHNSEDRKFYLIQNYGG
jgi:hypothetical protein